MAKHMASSRCSMSEWFLKRMSQGHGTERNVGSKWVRLPYFLQVGWQHFEVLSQLLSGKLRPWRRINADLFGLGTAAGTCNVACLQVACFRVLICFNIFSTCSDMIATNWSPWHPFFLSNLHWSIFTKANEALMKVVWALLGRSLDAVGFHPVPTPLKTAAWWMPRLLSSRELGISTSTGWAASHPWCCQCYCALKHHETKSFTSSGCVLSMVD